MNRASTGWRRSNGTTSPIQANDSGMIAAAITPEASRATISQRSDGASAQASEVSDAAAVAMPISRSLPTRSPSGP